MEKVNNFITSYNIYYGTISTGKIGLKDQITKNFKNEEEANKFAESAATSLYYKNEGKHGIPSFSTISKESEITGLSLETLYNDHIKDMCRWYAIPTELDTIPYNKLQW